MLLATGAFAQDAAKSTCDRACLENYLDLYLDAMMADDPNLELFTGDCIFTENGVRLPLGGEGLWYSMSEKGTYKFYIWHSPLAGTISNDPSVPNLKR